MDFTPQTTLTIREQQYTFVPSTWSPDKVFADRSGGRATIYKLYCQVTDTYHALKVFKPSLTNAYDSTNFAFLQARLPQMRHFGWVSQRMLLTAHDDAVLIADYPQFANAILMPWFDLLKLDDIRGRILNGSLTITLQKSQHFAQIIAHALAELEQHEIAHGDIASTNVLFDWTHDKIYIIDIEDMYHAALPRPASIAKGSGTPGYRFDSAYTSWSPYADRFAGAIIICEVLSLVNPECNEISAEESYFTQDDLNIRYSEDCDRYRVLYRAVSNQHAQLSQLLHYVWNETSLSNLPSLSTWADTLGRPATYEDLYPQQHAEPALVDATSMDTHAVVERAAIEAVDHPLPIHNASVPLHHVKETGADNANIMDVAGRKTRARTQYRVVQTDTILQRMITYCSTLYTSFITRQSFWVGKKRPSKRSQHDRVRRVISQYIAKQPTQKLDQ
jgi:hypothetical protein